MENHSNLSELLPIGNSTERVAYTKQEAKQLVITLYTLNGEEHIFLPYTYEFITRVNIYKYQLLNDDYLNSWRITLLKFYEEEDYIGFDKVYELIVSSGKKPTYEFKVVE